MKKAIAMLAVAGVFAALAGCTAPAKVDPTGCTATGINMSSSIQTCKATVGDQIKWR